MTPSPKVEAVMQLASDYGQSMYRRDFEPAGRQLKELRTTVEALAVDAERHRWVKDKAWYVDAAKFAHGIERRSGYSDEYRGADEDDIEAAIDAARTTQSQAGS